MSILLLVGALATTGLAFGLASVEKRSHAERGNEVKAPIVSHDGWTSREIIPVALPRANEPELSETAGPPVANGETPLDIAGRKQRFVSPIRKPVAEDDRIVPAGSPQFQNLIDIAIAIESDNIYPLAPSLLLGFFMPNASPYNLSLSRRGFVQAGFSSALGLGLTSVLGAQPKVETSKARKPKSVIIVFLTGAASHHDTFDMKPDMPEEIRGQFKPIDTSTPGLRICEHLPRLAKLMHHCALVRSLAHREDNHLLATHQVLTGMAIPGGKFDQIASRNDWPCYAGALDYSRPRSDGLPNGVTLPTFLMEGPLIWPGQHSGFLGAKHDPWHVKSDPNLANFKVESVRAADGPERIHERRSLLENMNLLGKDRATISDQQEQAFNVLTSGKVAQAFELEREPTEMRDRYGRHSFGQSLLLGRRLVEAGVPIVQCNMGRVQNWDHHGKIFPTLKDRMLPPTDCGVSALIEDLHARGLLQDTLVVMFGEFGRTPKVNKEGGRDHWGRAFFALFAGGGVKGGQVIGKTDKTGAAPISTPHSPMDLGATIYAALGVDHEAEIRDQLGRPVKLNTGNAIEALYG